MLPVSNSGIGGVLICAVPILESSGQLLLLTRWFFLNSPSLQATSPFAPDGLRPIPAGSVTLALRRCDWDCFLVGVGISNGTVVVAVAGAGESTAVVPGFTSMLGSNGTVSHFSCWYRNPVESSTLAW